MLAISVAWFGVSDVLHREVFDDARIEPINAAISRTGAAPLPSGAPTGPVPVVGTPTVSATPDRSAPTSRVTPSEPVRNSSRPRATRAPRQPVHIPVRSKDPATAEPRPFTTVPAPAPAPAPTGPAAMPGPSAAAVSDDNVRVVNVKGGSVSFAVESGACRLVAAAPNAGFEAKVSRALGWIRVDLVRDEHGSAVFCIGAEKRTDTWEY
ncbi:hypothetical protein Sros_7253 [Streptosporangium roseum DSM 43021]|uniref:Uncharacterized protein n=1 Tax=Streptosporangium roseum (strain ATCC 12428 / DSM 43021 / JCM 3005 / KCTC 9067 / NCIMB 10171 / NRRL 2505 / NI 9100) TaxID=479432 RepID=D2BCB2_STRRD|nr:hypothetical protein Sros_7253 [Streptosporangium roseum DSM 43021]